MTNTLNVEEPLITIIIPAYNAGKTIEKCLASICKSTYRNIEIVCIDDGSRDNTFQLLSNYHDSRVVVLQQVNQGVSVARNTGIDFAHGEYITFVDADDQISPNMIRNLYELIIIEPDIDMSGCSFTSDSFDSLDNCILNRKILCTSEAFGEYYFKTYIWGKLYKRSLIRNVRFADGVRFGEDKVFLTELKTICKKVCVTDSKLYYYFQNPDSVMHEKNPYITCDKTAEYCLKRMGEVNQGQEELLIRAYKYALTYRYSNRIETNYKDIKAKAKSLLVECDRHSSILSMKQRVLYKTLGRAPILYSLFRKIVEIQAQN